MSIDDDINPAAPRVSENAGSVSEVARVFLRLGLTTFGGPAAHISAMEDELVQRRGWVTRSEFVDLVSATDEKFRVSILLPYSGATVAALRATA